MSEVVLFIPGFFGFGSFGHPDRPLIEYFAHVEDAVLRALPRPMRFAVHEPPPAGSLAERAKSLHLKAIEVLQAGATKLHLVGHSTGGIDARLLANPKCGALPERADLLQRIASVTTVSAPFHGTPLARRAGRGAWLAMPVLWFGSILASRGRLRLAGQLGNLVNIAKRLTLQQPTPTDALIAQLADVDAGTAHEIRRFLEDVARDHRLVDDLSPEAMGELNRTLQGGDLLRLRSFVSAAPPAGLSPLAFGTAPIHRLLYDVAWSLTAAAPRNGECVPAGPWIGNARISLGQTTNDGIVPAWSQTLEGEAEGLVLGDHLDVIGHFESAGATFLRSGSKFDEDRFRALWARVAAGL
jgi:triacylglycerol lipase